MSNSQFKKDIIQKNHLNEKLNDIKTFIRQGYKINIDEKAQTQQKKNNNLHLNSTMRWLEKRKSKNNLNQTSQNQIPNFSLEDQKNSIILKHMYKSIQKGIQELKQQQQQQIQLQQQQQQIQQQAQYQQMLSSNNQNSNIMNSSNIDNAMNKSQMMSTNQFMMSSNVNSYANLQDEYIQDKINADDLYKLLVDNKFQVTQKLIQDIFLIFQTVEHDKQLNESQFYQMVQSEQSNRIYNEFIIKSKEFVKPPLKKIKSKSPAQQFKNFNKTPKYNNNLYTSTITPTNQQQQQLKSPNLLTPVNFFGGQKLQNFPPPEQKSKLDEIIDKIEQETETELPSTFSQLFMQLVYKLSHKYVVEYLKLSAQSKAFTIYDQIAGYDLLFKLIENANNNKFTTKHDKRVLRKFDPNLTQKLNQQQFIFNKYRSNKFAQSQTSDFLKDSENQTGRDRYTVFDQLNSKRTDQISPQNQTTDNLKFKKLEDQILNDSLSNSDYSNDSDHILITQLQNQEQAQKNKYQSQIDSICQEASILGKKQAKNEYKSQSQMALHSKSVNSLDNIINNNVTLPNLLNNSNSLIVKALKLKECKGGSLQVTKFSKNENYQSESINFLPKCQVKTKRPQPNNLKKQREKSSKYTENCQESIRKQAEDIGTKQRKELLKTKMLGYLNEVINDEKQQMVHDLINQIPVEGKTTERERLTKEHQEYQKYVKLFEIQHVDILEDKQKQYKRKVKEEKLKELQVLQHISKQQNDASRRYLKKFGTGHVINVDEDGNKIRNENDDDDTDRKRMEGSSSSVEKIKVVSYNQSPEKQKEDQTKQSKDSLIAKYGQKDEIKLPQLIKNVEQKQKQQQLNKEITPPTGKITFQSKFAKK